MARDTYDNGLHRWDSRLLTLANAYGFSPRVYRPHRAKTKDEIKRFNSYRKSSFITPIGLSLKSAGLALDLGTANAHIGRWLDEVAYPRIHSTTGVKPVVHLAEVCNDLMPLPAVTNSPSLPKCKATKAGFHHC